MKCEKCLRKNYCVYIHRFNHDPSVGCIEFINTENPTYISTTTLNIEELNGSSIMQPLEALKHIRNCHDLEFGEDKTMNELLSIIETALKALDIIKEKKVEVLWLMTQSLDSYNRNHFYTLTQEEYDLLKKVLK